MYTIIVYEGGAEVGRTTNLAFRQAKTLYNRLYQLNCCPDVYRDGVRLKLGQAFKLFFSQSTDFLYTK